MKRIAAYKNGNYFVELFEDGTKIKTTEDDFFDARFPDSMDMKITNYCDRNCPMCHEKSSVLGTHANLHHPILDTLPKGMELAIGGGNPLSHPDLEFFLKRMKERKIFCNLTVNEAHFLHHKEYLLSLMKNRYIYGLGISIQEYNPETIEFAKENRNTVIHTIAGLTDYSRLYDQSLKILVLGYKQVGRGKDFYNDTIQQKINELDENLEELYGHFDVISFDNLAIKQLHLKERTEKEIFEERFMGNDGEASMYIDLVKEEYALSSTSNKRYLMKETDTLEAIFQTIKQ